MIDFENIIPVVERQDVKTFLGEQSYGVADLEIDQVCEAVTALIASYVDFEVPTYDNDRSWPPNIKLGGKMLAGRLYRRRNSPAGVESLGELGPVYVSRNDPDLAQLLRIGRYERPRVG